MKFINIKSKASLLETLLKDIIILRNKESLNISHKIIGLLDLWIWSESKEYKIDRFIYSNNNEVRNNIQDNITISLISSILQVQFLDSNKLYYSISNIKHSTTNINILIYYWMDTNKDKDISSIDYISNILNNIDQSSITNILKGIYNKDINITMKMLNTPLNNSQIASEWISRVHMSKMGMELTGLYDVLGSSIKIDTNLIGSKQLRRSKELNTNIVELENNNNLLSYKANSINIRSKYNLINLIDYKDYIQMKYTSGLYIKIRGKLNEIDNTARREIFKETTGTFKNNAMKLIGISLGYTLNVSKSHIWANKYQQLTKWGIYGISIKMSSI